MKKSFKVDRYPDGKSFLYINSNKLDECLDYFKNGDFYGIGINSMKGYSSDNLDFLNQIPDVKGLSIEDTISNIDGINSQKGLKYLLINKVSNELDEDVIRGLDELRIAEWSSKFNLISKCENLESLYIYSYKPKENDLLGLSNLKRLKSLEIVKCPVTTLKGIDSIKSLNKLIIRYFSKLEYVGDIVNLELLEHLEFDHCSKIKDIEKISQLKQLSLLGINSCGKIPSLAFLKDISNLKRLAFVKTEIIDGDFSFFLDMPVVEYVGYFDKKHYSIKSDDLNSLLDKKKGHKKL
ncbi:MAG TPA: hypothetical protein PK624_09160 [Spirochaetota bacterium]|nr:hypothetical protein [Spirochaetota bacterium]HOR44951.1 hypothetical protein [Spirochaetota bacterium]HPK56941.1 hypothetical protein [Spirochaetota bacterium]